MLKLKNLHPEFGVEIIGIDLSEALEPNDFSQIELALEQYSLVLFRKQVFDDDSQVVFSRRFGELEYDHVAYGRERKILYIGRIGNVDKHGQKMSANHERVVFSTGNEMWHSDSSFRPIPTRFSISYAYEVTPEGGELEFVSTRSAYARLSDKTKDKIENLVAIHDYVYSRSKVGPNAVTPSHAASLPPVSQRLVRKNPVTGEKNYYVGSHARSIENWRDVDARALLDDLTARATRPEDVCRHHWQVGDLLIWDNRCILHRGNPYDADRYRRRMHQTRVAGVRPTLEE
jgi:alpha-ketoglutarate-dependent 2,4-dichlorophenoxyacetate dioxygenase